MIAVDLPVALQQMIEARLDSVERALMTQSIGRGDRQQILSAIEDQILEMLGQTVGEEPTRADLLGVLARLDPPEAYLEISDRRMVEPMTGRDGRLQAGRALDALAEGQKGLNVMAGVAFALACMACLGAFTYWLLDYYGLFPLSILTVAAGICGILSLCQFTQNRGGQRGLWMAVCASASPLLVAFLAWATYWVLATI